MTTKTPVKQPQKSNTDRLAATDVFPLLADDRRRYVLHYLSPKAGAVSLGELAEQIAVWEDDPTYDRYERILTSLHHIHLPKLVDAGLVRYTVETESVKGLDSLDSVRSYLDLACRDDCR